MPSWPQFREGISNLNARSVPLEGPVNFGSMRLGSSSERQVVAALRALGLVDRSDVADFRLRRLVLKEDYSALVEALEDRFEDLVEAIRSGASAEQLETILDALGATQSSTERFWRFVRDAYAAAGLERPPLLRLTGNGTRLNRPAGGRQTRQSDKGGEESHARVVLKEELDMYLRALETALTSGNAELATKLSDRLVLLREELRAQT
jgi:hypothetical protein